MTNKPKKPSVLKIKPPNDRFFIYPTVVLLFCQNFCDKSAQTIHKELNNQNTLFVWITSDDKKPMVDTPTKSADAVNTPKTSKTAKIKISQIILILCQ